jgi:hypothetical protein
MWDEINDDIRPDLMANVRKGLQVLPFYPECVRTTDGAAYDFFERLLALLADQRVKKAETACSKVIRLARRWLFYAWRVPHWWTTEPSMSATEKKFWHIPERD